MATGNKYKKQSLLQAFLIVVALVLANVVLTYSFIRIDLTKEKRFTISNSTKKILKEIDDVVYFEIFLEGKLPADYRRLKVAISDLLDEYNARTDHYIEYTFEDVFENNDPKQANEVLKTLIEKGVVPRPIAEKKLDEVSQKVLLPAAIVHYKDREYVINFLPEKKALNENTAEVINKGIATLEFNLSNALQKLQQTRKKKVVFIQGHGELTSRYVGDLAVSLQQQQFDVVFMDLTHETGITRLVDAIVIAKPTNKFSEQDKFKIDQYIMNGGNVLWVLDAMYADLDSFGRANEFTSTAINLNLDDQLFSYGVRINKDLILDKQANPIPVFAQNGEAQNMYPWYFFPVLFPKPVHPVTKHLDPVMTEFVSSMDTIQNKGIKKTILLQTSNQSTAWKTPVLVRLSLAVNPPLPEQFNKSELNVGVLLEGRFKSIFKGRVPKSFIRVYEDSLKMKYRDTGVGSKMIVFSDGDMIKNRVDKQGRIQLLGSYRFNPNFLFANRDLMLNCIDYLTDNFGLIETRNKEFKIRPLDKQKAYDERLKWQAVNLGLPVLLILVFALVFNFVRKRKYEGKV
jgi:gliding motility-associatede transport system auxiliary component